MEIKRIQIDTSLEENIIAGMITSKRLMQDLVDLWKIDFFKNSYLGIISSWCYDYYHDYKENIGTVHIWDYYNSELRTGQISDELRDFLKTTLDRVSERYTDKQEVNYEYIRKETIRYFQERNFEITMDQASLLRERGQIDKAQEIFHSHKKLIEIVSEWGNPIEPKRIREIFQVKEDNNDLRLGYALGDLLGPIERGSLTGILAPTKRGKTWALKEFGAMGLYQNMKIAYVSLEMRKKEISERFTRRFVPAGSYYYQDWFTSDGDNVDTLVNRRPGNQRIKYPAFDCVLNQNGQCERAERLRYNSISLIVNGNLPEFDGDMDYRPCDYCRKNKITGYQRAFWWEMIELPPYTEQLILREMDKTVKLHGDNLRDIVYPRYSVGIDKIFHDLEILRQREGFIADMVLFDYPDITKSTSKEQTMDDIVWKEFSALIGELNVIGVAPVQATRFARQKDLLDDTDIAGYIGKTNHMNILIGLNQTLSEAQQMQMRVNLIFTRGRAPALNKCALMLQNLSVGQFHLDSEMVYYQSRQQNGG